MASDIVKVVMLKDTEKTKAGEEYYTKREDAESYKKHGLANIIEQEEPKKETQQEPKQSKNIDYHPLKRDYPQEEAEQKINRSSVYKRVIEIAAQMPPLGWAQLRKYDLKLLKKLKIGYISEKIRKEIEKEFDKDILKRYRIPDFYNRVIIPFSEDYFCGRSINPKIKQKNLFPKNLRKQYWYIKSEMEEPEALFIVEGETDAIAAYHCFQEYDILAIGGVKSDILNEIHNYLRSKKIIICFDKDAAGFEAANKLIRQLTDAEIECEQYIWDVEVKDLDDLRKQFGCHNIKKMAKLVKARARDVFIEEGFKPITKTEVKEVIDKQFPGLWGVYDVCISTIAVLKLEDWSDPVGINIVGCPSGEKTTVLSFFYECDNLVIKSDNFTPKCFVSHSANVKKEELEEIDLLPKIKDKCMIVPELAPIFGKRKEDLLESIGTITRVFDGEGYVSDSGSQGHRGYEGDYKFVWLGATTPPPRQVWQVMGNMGTRWFFCEINDVEKAHAEKIDMLHSNNTYSKKIKLCRDVTKKFIKSLFSDGMKRNMVWDNTKNEEVAIDLIVECADFLKKIRANILIWEDEHSHELEHETPLIEKPYRIMNILTNLAKGHAITEGRDFINLEDIPCVVKVAFSSMPENRRKLFKFLIKHLDTLMFDAEIIGTEINCGNKQALKTLETLEKLEILKEIYNEERLSAGNPRKEYIIQDNVKKAIKKLLPYYEQVDNTFPKSATAGYTSSKVALHEIENRLKEEVVNYDVKRTLAEKGKVFSSGNEGVFEILKDILFNKKHQKDNAEEIEVACGKDQVQLWIKEGTIFEPEPGTYTLL